MEIFPAIDIQGGQAVRLTQGDYARKTIYSPSPLDVALGFAADGAANLHTVDLDGAKDGGLSNFEVIAGIREHTDLFMQVGGGIRDRARVERYLSIGVNRVILGTAALENFDFLRGMVGLYGERVAVGVDARDGKVAVRGWLEVSGTDSVEFCAKLGRAGVRTIIYTDIARDGTGQGANIGIYKRLTCEVPEVRFIASGGVTFREELVQLERAGAYGVILGKALYTGKLSLREILSAKGEAT